MEEKKGLRQNNNQGEDTKHIGKEETRKFSYL
jgi:hypothetical protein